MTISLLYLPWRVALCSPLAGFAFGVAAFGFGSAFTGSCAALRETGPSASCCAGVRLSVRSFLIALDRVMPSFSWYMAMTLISSSVQSVALTAGVFSVVIWLCPLPGLPIVQGAERGGTRPRSHQGGHTSPDQKVSVEPIRKYRN